MIFFSERMAVAVRTAEYFFIERGRVKIFFEWVAAAVRTASYRS